MQNFKNYKASIREKIIKEPNIACSLESMQYYPVYITKKKKNISATTPYPFLGRVLWMRFTCIYLKHTKTIDWIQVTQKL